MSHLDIFLQINRQIIFHDAKRGTKNNSHGCTRERFIESQSNRTVHNTWFFFKCPATQHCNENSIYVFLFWELRGLSPIFLHLYVCGIYKFPGSAHLFPAAEQSEFINRSQTHEFGNWDCGRKIPFLGIFVSNFRYWFFAVHPYRGYLRYMLLKPLIVSQSFKEHQTSSNLQTWQWFPSWNINYIPNHQSLKPPPYGHTPPSNTDPPTIFTPLHTLISPYILCINTMGTTITLPSYIQGHFLTNEVCTVSYSYSMILL